MARKVALALLSELTTQQLFFIYRLEPNSEGWLAKSVPPAGLSIQEDGFSGFLFFFAIEQKLRLFFSPCFCLLSLGLRW